MTRLVHLALATTLLVACSGGDSDKDMAVDAPPRPKFDYGPDRGNDHRVDFLAANCDHSTLAKQVDPARLLTDLTWLTELGDRFSHQGQSKVADYLKAELGKLAGVTLTEQSYQHNGETYVNLVATIAGTVDKDRYVMAGAHYDSVTATSPGADDNASGTATVLEAARVLHACPGKKSTRLLFFSNAHTVGSAAYVTSIKGLIPPDKLEGYINVDMVAFGPDTEDLDLVTKPEHQELVSSVKSAIDKEGVVKTKSFIGNHCG